MVRGHRVRLVQVVDNLISNALKFTPSGGRVDVRLSAVDGAAVIEVQDTGLGISDDEQQQLFERFFRSSQATKNQIPGSGLGLTITKAIVERHGGQIELESSEGVGTTVRVRLPLSSEKLVSRRPDWLPKPGLPERTGALDRPPEGGSGSLSYDFHTTSQSDTRV